MARQRMIQLIKDIRKEGSIRLLISSHLLRDIDETCDEVLILKSGRIAALCNIEEERRSNRSFMELETVGATEQFSVSIRGLGCECASFPGGRIKLVIPDHIEARDLYVIASEQGVQIRRMNQRRDSLEDIFLRAMDNDQGRAANGQSISTTTAPITGTVTPAWTRVLVLARYAFAEAWSSKITVGLFIFCLFPASSSLLRIYLANNPIAQALVGCTEVQRSSRHRCRISFLQVLQTQSWLALVTGFVDRSPPDHLRSRR